MFRAVHNLIICAGAPLSFLSTTEIWKSPVKRLLQHLLAQLSEYFSIEIVKAEIARAAQHVLSSRRFDLKISQSYAKMA